MKSFNSKHLCIFVRACGEGGGEENAMGFGFMRLLDFLRIMRRCEAEQVLCAGNPLCRAVNSIGSPCAREGGIAGENDRVTQRF